MKHLLIASLLVFATPDAEAGDVSLDVGVRRGKVRVGVSYRERDRRSRRVVHRPAHRVDHRVGRRVGRRVARRPAPRVRHRPIVRRHWVPGHYDTVARRVWVAGHYDRVYVPARYAYRSYRGRRVRYCEQVATYERVWVPGYYKTKYVKVWVPGHFH